MENIKQRNELAPSSLTDEEVIAEAQRVIEHADAWHQDGNYRAQVKPEWVLADAAKVIRDLLALLDPSVGEAQTCIRVESGEQGVPCIDKGPQFIRCDACERAERQQAGDVPQGEAPPSPWKPREGWSEIERVQDGIKASTGHRLSCQRFTPPTIKMFPGDVVYDASKPCTCADPPPDREIPTVVRPKSARASPFAR